MRDISSVFSLLVLAGCTSAPPAPTISRPAPILTPSISYTFSRPCNELGPEVLGAIVRISTDSGSHGSGVIVRPDRVITAAHVVSDALSTEVAFADGLRAARVLAFDRSADLALLEVSTHGRDPLPLADHALSHSESVWAVGYPLAMDQAITRGEFQRRANGKLYTSAWITSGNSGGGLLRCADGRFELAGILRDYVAYLRDGMYINADQSTSTPAQTVRDFMLAIEIGYAL